MDEKRIKNWAHWLKNLEKGGQFFFTLHQPNNESTPELISFFNPQIVHTIKEQISAPQKNLFDI